MDDAQTGAMTHVTCNEWTVGNFTRSFDGFSADGDGVTDGLSDGLTDKSNEVWMERKFPGNWTFGILCPAILVGIFTMNLADGWMDGADDRHTDIWKEFQMESHLG